MPHLPAEPLRLRLPAARRAITLPSGTAIRLVAYDGHEVLDALPARICEQTAATLARVRNREAVVRTLLSPPIAYTLGFASGIPDAMPQVFLLGWRHESGGEWVLAEYPTLPPAMLRAFRHERETAQNEPQARTWPATSSGITARAVSFEETTAHTTYATQTHFIAFDTGRAAPPVARARTRGRLPGGPRRPLPG